MSRSCMDSLRRGFTSRITTSTCYEILWSTLAVSSTILCILTHHRFRGVDKIQFFEWQWLNGPSWHMKWHIWPCTLYHGTPRVLIICMSALTESKVMAPLQCWMQHMNLSWMTCVFMVCKALYIMQMFCSISYGLWGCKIFYVLLPLLWARCAGCVCRVEFILNTCLSHKCLLYCRWRIGMYHRVPLVDYVWNARHYTDNFCLSSVMI